MMRITSLYLICVLMLPSCQSFDEASKVLKNEKVRTTDEFLVKKREPLILLIMKKFQNHSLLIKKKGESDKIKKILIHQ